MEIHAQNLSSLTLFIYMYTAGFYKTSPNMLLFETRYLTFLLYTWCDIPVDLTVLCHDKNITADYMVVGYQVFPNTYVSYRTA